jgi:hypothetical protein
LFNLATIRLLAASRASEYDLPSRFNSALTQLHYLNPKSKTHINNTKNKTKQKNPNKNKTKPCCVKLDRRTKNTG